MDYGTNKEYGITKSGLDSRRAFLGLRVAGPIRNVELRNLTIEHRRVYSAGHGTNYRIRNYVITIELALVYSILIFKSLNT
jgi:hypothetical protein